jgi:uncharacterized protein (TIGR00369 family)
MGVSELIEQIVPRELFSFRSDGTVEERAQHLIEQCHPGATRMKLKNLTGDFAEAEIPYAMENRALHGFLHGGCYFTVGDTLTAIMCIYFLEEPGERMLTMDASIRYLRPIVRDMVLARARLVSRNGKQLNFVCDFYNEQNKRAAQAKYRYVLAVPAAS